MPANDLNDFCACCTGLQQFVSNSTGQVPMFVQTRCSTLGTLMVANVSECLLDSQVVDSIVVAAVV